MRTAVSLDGLKEMCHLKSFKHDYRHALAKLGVSSSPVVHT